MPQPEPTQEDRLFEKIDIQSRLQKKKEEKLLEYRRRNPADPKNLSHCEYVGTWKAKWRELHPGDAEEEFERYELFEQELWDILKLTIKNRDT